MTRAPLESPLKHNAAVGLVEAMHGGAAATDAFAEAGGLDATVELLCTEALPSRLQQTAVDFVCCVAAVTAHREPLIEKGVVEALAKALLWPGFEVKICVLLGLGMLLQHEPSQLVLAQQPASMRALLELMRQKEDPDCQHVARDIFAGLAGNKECKSHVEAAMRGATVA